MSAADPDPFPGLFFRYGFKYVLNMNRKYGLEYEYCWEYELGWTEYALNTGSNVGFESVLNSVENIGRERKYEYKLRLGIVIFGLQPRCLGRIKPIPSSRVHSPQNTCRILFRAIFPMLAEVPRIGC